MPTSNVFNPQLTDVKANTFIQDTAVDTTAAQTFTLLSGAGVQIGKEIATGILTGNTTSPDEVTGDATLLPQPEDSPEDQQRALGSINDLGKLAAARKAGLPLAQAKSRATTILKTAINDNPFFADDIRKSYQSFFGGSGASIFKMTPQEQATADYQANVSATALKLQTSFEVAATRIRDVEESAFKKQQMEIQSRERQLNGDDYVAYAQNNAVIARTNVSSAIIAEYNTNGSLSPEKVAEFKQQLPLLESQLHTELRRLQVDEDGNPRIGKISAKSRDAAQKVIDDTIRSLNALIDDSSMQKIISANAGITKNNYDMIVLKHFGAIKAVKDTMGEDYVKYVLQSAKGNKALTTIMENDPYFSEIAGRTGNFEKDLADLIGFGVKGLLDVPELSGDPEQAVTNEVKGKTHGGILALLSSTNSSQLFEKAIDINPDADTVVAAAIIKSPGALINFNKPEYAAKIARNPEKWKPMLEKSIDAVRRSTMAHYMIENGGIPTNFDIQGLRDGFSPNPPTADELRSATRYRATGDGVDGVMQSNINMIRAVAQKNPMLWEGEHESALDYIRSIFNIEVGVRQDAEPSGE